MQVQEVIDLFEKYWEDPVGLPAVSGPRDLVAFNLLQRLVPSDDVMIGQAEHDIIYLRVTPDDLAKSEVTLEDIRVLCSLGIHYDGDGDCLAKFA